MLRLLLLFFISTSLIFVGCVDESKGKKPLPQSLAIIKKDPLPDGYRICLMGDMGTGYNEQAMVANALFKEDCDQVRMLGDIIYEAGLKDANDKQFTTKFYKPYKAFIEASNPIPLYIALGNHDYGGNPGAWFDLAKKYPAIKFPDYYYAESHDDVCFVSFDSNAWFDEQTKWMQKIKPELDKTCKLSFAFAHHPYLNAGEHGDAVEEKDFLDTNVIGKFTFYFAGHDHSLQDEGDLKGTRLIVSGAGGNGLYPFLKKPIVFGDDKIYGYVVLDILRNENKLSAHYKFVGVNDTVTKVVFENTIEVP
ncbi:MAG: metallophosphoesterase [Bacteriovoracaceae bacterium]